MKHLELTSKEFREGYAAADFYAKGLVRNPYPSGTKQWFDFRSGFTTRDYEQSWKDNYEYI